jgi:hypothetical protein
MDKTLKSLAGSLAILFLYFYATEGMVRLFSTNSYKHTLKIIITSITLLVLSLLLIIVPYKIFGPSGVDVLYMCIISFHCVYLIAGCTVNFLIKH